MAAWLSPVFPLVEGAKSGCDSDLLALLLSDTGPVIGPIPRPNIAKNGKSCLHATSMLHHFGDAAILRRRQEKLQPLSQRLFTRWSPDALPLLLPDHPPLARAAPGLPAALFAAQAE